MYFGNMKFGKVRMIAATTLTLLLSIAQPAGAGTALYGFAGMNPIDSGIDQGFSTGLVDMDEAGFLGGSNARLVASAAYEPGEISVIEMVSAESIRTHFNFKSKATDQMVSATLVENGTNYALTYNLPAGQILLENDTISVITATGFSQVNMPEALEAGFENQDFVLLLNDALRGSDLAGFNLTMLESIAEDKLQSLAFIPEQYSKGRASYTEGGWACAGALTALAAANAALAAAIAATYMTIGAAAAAIAAAVTAIGLAMTLVDQYCLQM